MLGEQFSLTYSCKMRRQWLPLIDSVQRDILVSDADVLLKMAEEKKERKKAWILSSYSEHSLGQELL